MERQVKMCELAWRLLWFSSMAGGVVYLASA
jgi:hypothetical protein